MVIFGLNCKLKNENSSYGILTTSTDQIQLIYSCFSRNLVSTNSIAPCSVYKPYTTHNSSIRSDEGLTLETSAFLYGGQFTLSTPLINQIFVYHSPTAGRSTTVSLETNPL